MTETDKKPVRAGAPRWMKILLVASLAVNLLILGAVAGAAISGGGKWRDRAGGPEGPGAFTRALDDDDRRVLKRRMVKEFRRAPGGRAAFREATGEIVMLLRAEPFDAQAATEKMAQVRGLFERRMHSAQDLLVVYWGEMEPADRAAYADRLEEELRRKRR